MSDAEPVTRPHLVRLGIHLGLSNLAHIAIGVTDVAMTGRLGGNDLAAAALGSSLYLVFALAAAGFAAGVGPLLARYRGAGDKVAFAGTIWAASFCLVLFVGPATLLLTTGEQILLMGSLNPVLSSLAGSYLSWLSAALPFSLAFSLLWTVASATGRSGVVMWVSLAAIAINAGGNYVFMFGHFGIPAMGLAGAGVSTLLTAALKFLVLIVYLRPRSTPIFQPHGLIQLCRPVLRDGLPLAVLELATMGYFAAITFVVGLIGSAQLAAHAVALQIAEIGIGFAFGFSEAAAVSVAFDVGRQDLLRLRHTIRRAILLGAGGMLFYAVILALFPKFLALLFVDPNVPLAGAVTGFTMALLPIAALCLAADCGRIVLVGVLRGLGDTRHPVMLNLAGFWLVAFPLAFVLSNDATLGISGIWFGMAAGMGVVTILLWMRLKGSVQALS